jgi:hypothetical protein
MGLYQNLEDTLAAKLAAVGTGSHIKGRGDVLYTVDKMNCSFSDEIQGPNATIPNRLQLRALKTSEFHTTH